MGMCCTETKECYVKSEQCCVCCVMCIVHAVCREHEHCGNRNRETSRQTVKRDVLDNDRPRGAAAGERACAGGSAGGK